jgi:hypothetical protein
MRVLMVNNRFAPMILSGRKTQTIRKTARCGPGDLLSLRRWAGVPYRTPQLKISDAWCTWLSAIVVDKDQLMLDFRPLSLPDATAFAWKDGFDSLDEMIDFFNCQYSLPFKGVVIEFKLLDETERRRAWAAMRLTPEERRRALPGIGCMTICEHLGRLQAVNEGRAWK